MKTVHVSETDLALYAGGDLPFWQWPFVRLHVNRCSSCHARVAAYRHDRQQVQAFSDELPEGVEWDRLAPEMMANIRVGLAAGECVARPERRPSLAPAWRVVMVLVGFTVLVASAWWLNLPKPQSEALERTVTALAHGRTNAPWRRGFGLDEPGPTLEATPTGIELRQNGSAMGVLKRGTLPVAVSLSVQGAARASYIDADTGQVTITSVYAQ